MNLNFRSIRDGVRSTLAGTLVSLLLCVAAVVAAAFPVWLATPFLTGTLGMQLRPAILVVAALEVLIGVLVIKLWQGFGAA